MGESSKVGFEVREEMMVSLTGGGNPTKRLAHFLSNEINSIDASVVELPSHCLYSIPATFEPKKWPLKVEFQGWRSPQRHWKTWVGKMAALHESTWKKAGIHEAILNSTYEIRRNYDLILGLAEKWCPETKSFIFPWGEATVTLEDVMISGYSVLGCPVFSRLQTDGLKEVEDKLNQERKQLNSATKKSDHSAWMKKFMDSESEIEHEAFLALWLSRFVLPTSCCLIVKSIFPIAIHLARGTRIALAPAILASIYRDLGLLKEKIVALTVINNWQDEHSRLAVAIRSPFQLVQIWAWERLIELRPKPNLIKNGEARFAQWHKIMIRVENVRTVLDSAQESFDWRPYAKTLENWNLPNFYREKEMWVLVDADLSEELQSLVRCLRISKLVGIDCIEQYLPHRVSMQFGIDQDLPAFAGQAKETLCAAWSHYSKPISYANLYIPSRLYEADVTTRYMEWWKQSMSRRQVASGGVLPQERIFTSSEITPKRSERAKKRSFTGFESTPCRAKRMMESDVLSCSKVTAKRSKRTNKRNFIARAKITPRRLDRMKDPDGAFISPSFSRNRLENSSETSKRKRRDTDSSLALGSTLKKTKKSVQTSNENKEVSDASASAELPSKKLPLSLIIKKEADNSSVPPGFPPKSNLVKARNSAKEDDLAITESVESSKKQNDVQNTKVCDSENSSCHTRTCSTSIADGEAIKIIGPLTELAEKAMQNEPACDGSEAVRADATESRASCPVHGMARNRGSNRDGKNYASELPNLGLEARVSRLERIFVKLKAAKFGHKRPVIVLD